MNLNQFTVPQITIYFQILEQQSDIRSRPLQRWHLPRLSVRLRGDDNLGDRSAGRGSIVNDDRHVRRTIRHGGLFESAVAALEASSADPFNRHCADVLRRLFHEHRQDDVHERHPQRGDESAAAVCRAAHDCLHQQYVYHGRVQEWQVRISLR